MWRNYLTVGVRALAKNKTYAFINIFGLAIGLAACLTILLYVRYELSYENWLPDADRVYQVQSVATDPETGTVEREQMSAMPVGEALVKDFPQIEAKTRALTSAPIALRNGEATEAEMLLVDADFFKVMDLPFVHGNARTALQQMESLVLTEAEAIRRFGRSDILGERLTVVRRGQKHDLRVTGILRDLPDNTHLDFTMLARFNPADYAESPDFLTAWGIISGYNYVKLRPGADVAAIHSQLPAWEKRNIPVQNFGGARTGAGDNRDWYLTRLADVHLGEAQLAAMSPGNDRRTIITFAVIAVLILGMACVNFTNLATARASQRAREVALRKVLGASRKQLVVQFIGESMLLAGLSMLLALALVELALPAFSAFLEAELKVSYFGSEGLILPIVALVLVVGAAGGLYPAFYLSRFQPAAVLKANKSTAEAQGSGRLRNILVVAQFAVSIGLIICTAVVYAQTVFARTSDPGYRRDGLIQIGNVGRRQVTPVIETLAREIRRTEGVSAATLTNVTIGDGNIYATGVQIAGRTEPVPVEIYSVDAAFFDAMGMKLIAGRGLSDARAMDDATTPLQEDRAADEALARRGINVVVNELAARRLGFASPAAAVGKQVRSALVDEEIGLVPTNIVGVVQTARFRSIRDAVEPTMYGINRNGYNNMMVRFEGDPAAVRNRLEAVWKRVVPDVPFEADFADAVVAELYQADQARAQTFAGFALLAVIVACLGLFGLAAFTAERRTKEIGIRKVLGARSRDIVQLLAWQFSKPVIVANLIAWPVAWWVMRDWLNSFDTRIDLGPTPFLLAGLLALAIAIGTIAGHALKVARSNPIHALRYE